MTLPAGWTVASRPGNNTASITKGASRIFITIGKSASSDVVADLQADVKGEGFPSSVTLSAVKTPSGGGIFDKAAIQDFTDPTGTYAQGRLVELLDSSSSSNFSVFMSVKSKSVSSFNAIGPDITKVVESVLTGAS